MLKIGILKADSVLPQFQIKHGDYPSMFEVVLTDAATEPVTFVTYDVEHGEYPDDVDDCDGYIITGSKKSVYDDEPWIHELENYVRVLHQAKKKLVGICFGHQMVAQALGGKTEAAKVGWCVGVQTSTVTSNKDYMQPPRETLAVLSSHKDQVTVLPEGAEVLATSERCPNMAFQIGEHILTFQGHPEFKKGYSEDLMDMREDILGEDIYQTGKTSLTIPLDSDALASWIMHFLAA